MIEQTFYGRVLSWNTSIDRIQSLKWTGKMVGEKKEPSKPKQHLCQIHIMQLQAKSNPPMPFSFHLLLQCM